MAKKIIGWREWLRLPELGIANIKAKVDTGARSSSLHAYDIREYKRSGHTFVEFKVHPKQRNSKLVVKCHARVLEYRKVKSSSGHSELRPVILTPVELLGESWQMELTLTNRDQMGFRMLLGRESIRKRFLVDVSHSFLGVKKPKVRKLK